jgi:hypothetical protein
VQNQKYHPIITKYFTKTLDFSNNSTHFAKRSKQGMFMVPKEIGFLFGLVKKKSLLLLLVSSEGGEEHLVSEVQHW